MKNLGFAVVLVVGFANTAFAESWLCIGEAEAGVSTTAPFTSAEITPGDDKYLVIINEDTNEVGIKKLGGVAWPVTCKNSLGTVSCNSLGFEFLLYKGTLGFWHLSTKKVDSKLFMTVESGKCSTI